jgi:hypothetical protein
MVLHRDQGHVATTTNVVGPVRGGYAYDISSIGGIWETRYIGARKILAWYFFLHGITRVPCGGVGAVWHDFSVPC